MKDGSWPMHMKAHWKAGSQVGGQGGAEYPKICPAQPQHIKFLQADEHAEAVRNNACLHFFSE